MKTGLKMGEVGSKHVKTWGFWCILVLIDHEIFFCWIMRMQKWAGELGRSKSWTFREELRML